MCICICERQIIFLRKHCKCNIIRFIIYSYEQSTTIVGLIIDVNLRINSQLRLSLMIQHIHITTTIQIIYTKSFKVQEHNTFRLIRYNSYCYNEESVKINQGLSNIDDKNIAEKELYNKPYRFRNTQIARMFRLDRDRENHKKLLLLKKKHNFTESINFANYV